MYSTIIKKEIGFALVRLNIGLIFIVHGMVNIFYLSSFEERTIGKLSKIDLFPGSSINDLAIVLPFVEVFLGIFLFAGLLTKVVLRIFHGAYIAIALIFTMLNELDTAFFYVLLATLLFFLSIKVRYNYWCLDKKFT